MLVRRRVAPLVVDPTTLSRHRIEADDQPDRGYAGDTELVFEGP